MELSVAQMMTLRRAANDILETLAQVPPQLTTLARWVGTNVIPAPGAKIRLKDLVALVNYDLGTSYTTRSRELGHLLPPRTKSNGQVWIYDHALSPLAPRFQLIQ